MSVIGDKRRVCHVLVVYLCNNTEICAIFRYYILQPTSFPLRASSTPVHAEQVAKMTTKRYTKASNLGDNSAKRWRRLEDEASQPSSLPVRPYTEALMLLQSLRKWTPRNLEVTRLSLIDNASHGFCRWLYSQICLHEFASILSCIVICSSKIVIKVLGLSLGESQDANLITIAAFEKSAVFLYHPSRENLVMGPNIPDGTPFSRLFAHFNRVLLRQNTSKFLVSCSSLLMRLVAIISGFEAAGNL